MPRFVEGCDRTHSTLFPKRLDDFIGEDNPVRVIDAYVEELKLGKLGFDGVRPESTGRPACHPSTLLKIYIYGYLNRIQSSRRLERETQRNVELFWLTGQLSPDFKTIADFRKDNGPAIRKASLQPVHRDVPPSAVVLGSDRGDRRQQVQGRQQHRPEFYRREGQGPNAPAPRTASAATWRNWTVPTERRR